MKQVRLLSLVCAIVLIVTAMCSCAVQPTPYQSWGKQINTAPKLHKTKEDISLILGSEPDKCETIPGKPTIGMLFRHDSGTAILDIYPNSPAAGTDIKVGDKVLSVNSKPVHSMEDIIASTEGIEGPNSSITIETQRGTYVVTPKYSTESEQCYWKIIPERGELNGEKTGQRGTAHQRYFLATCRFTGGKAYICRSRWQE